MTVQSWTANPYPRPRGNRRVIAPSSDPNAIFTPPPPRSRALAFTLQRDGSANSRITAVFGPFTGPAVLKHLTVAGQMSATGTQDGPCGFVIRYHDAPPTTGTGTRANMPPGTDVFEYDPETNPVTSRGTNPGVLPLGNIVGASIYNEVDLGYLIQAPQFWLSLTALGATNATNNRAEGMLTLTENIDPRLVATFMAG